ncbi:MAG: UDP-glucose 4-epimerase GalE [Anaerolineaceae bacterium]|nr:UDP-glucose 4-epimerase GalE [Anaerolineaceae bacterium]
MKILVTGGAGFIGSTICSALLDAGHTPIILDSLVTGRIEFTRGRIFYKGDIADSALVKNIFNEHPDIYATIHCAALIIVPESTVKPYEYYRENVAKSLELFHTLIEIGSRRLVFSSSASVYDVVPGFMVTETSPLKPSNPYGRTKFMVEMILRDFCAAYNLQGIALRYFNPIGADPKMRTGLPIKNPSHAIGKLVDVQLGKIPQFTITGTDYETRDGTGIRDYIHIWDLVQAHILAVENFDDAFKNAGNPDDNYLVINLGTGRGVTVRELVNAFEKVVGEKINKVDGARRPGDAAGSFCNADTAKKLLGWTAQLSIEQGISDSLKWGVKRDSILPD